MDQKVCYDAWWGNGPLQGNAGLHFQMHSQWLPNLHDQCQVNYRRQIEALWACMTAWMHLGSWKHSQAEGLHKVCWPGAHHLEVGSACTKSPTILCIMVEHTGKMWMSNMARWFVMRHCKLTGLTNLHPSKDKILEKAIPFFIHWPCCLTWCKHIHCVTSMRF